MRNNKNKTNIKIIVYRVVMVIVILCLTLLTFQVVTNNKDGRRQIVDENGGVEVTKPIILSEDEENGGSVQ